MWQQEEGGPGERSPFCAKSLSAIWGPCVQHDCLLALGQGPKRLLEPQCSMDLNCLGLAGRGSGIS